MSYCRFSNADIYLFPHVDGWIECGSCSLADKVPSIFTTGEGSYAKLLGITGPCKTCTGVGCDTCMVYGSARLATPAEALAHVAAHRAAGHMVPTYVDDLLKEEARGNRETD